MLSLAQAWAAEPADPLRPLPLLGVGFSKRPRDQACGFALLECEAGGSETPKWRRKGLKQLIPRPEMVWPRKPLTPNIRRREPPPQRWFATPRFAGSTDKYRARCRSSRLLRQPFTRFDTKFFDS